MYALFALAALGASNDGTEARLSRDPTDDIQQGHRDLEPMYEIKDSVTPTAFMDLRINANTLDYSMNIKLTDYMFNPDKAQPLR